jgi:hypothetical protein
VEAEGVEPQRVYRILVGTLLFGRCGQEQSPRPSEKLLVPYLQGESILGQMSKRVGRAFQKLYATPVPIVMNDDGAQFTRPPGR